jgi:hypothetical protein
MAKKDKVFYSVDFFAKLHAGEVDSLGNELKVEEPIQEVETETIVEEVETLEVVVKEKAKKGRPKSKKA